MHGRIGHLEDLVKRLIDQHQGVSSSSKDVFHSAGSPNREARSTLPDRPPGARTIDCAESTNIDDTHSVYHNENDWYTVLQEVRWHYFLPGNTLIISHTGQQSLLPAAQTDLL